MALNATELAIVMVAARFTPPGFKHPFTGSNDAQRKQIAWWDNAIAVAGGESDLNPDIVNPQIIGGKQAVGLWQVMTPVNKPDLIESRKRPYSNTLAARTLYESRKWQPWDSSKGSHRESWRGHGASVFAYINSKTPQELTSLGIGIGLPGAEGVDEYVLPIPVGPTKEGIKEVVDDIPAWLSGVLTAIAGWALPIGVFLLGVILLVLGLWLLAGKPGGNLAKKLPGV